MTPGRAALAHVLEAVSAAPLREEPYRHLLIDEVFPEDYYREMIRRFPASSQMHANPVHPVHQADLVPDPGVTEAASGAWAMEAKLSGRRLRFWADFREAFFSGNLEALLMDRFQEYLEPKLNELQRLGMLPGNYYAVGRLALDHRGAGLGPHVDRTDKLVSAVMYLAVPGAMPLEGSGTQLLRPKESVEVSAAHRTWDEFDIVSVAEYAPNRMICWPVTDDSWHAYHEQHGYRRTIKYFVQAAIPPETVRAEIARTKEQSHRWKRAARA